MDFQPITREVVNLPARKSDSFKGQNGRVLVVAGSPEFPGAAALASISALRSGADSVVLATPEKVAWTVNCLYPDVITHKLAGAHLSLCADHVDIEQYLMADCVLIGPGVSDNNESRRLMTWIAGKASLLKVIDAGAIRACEFNSLRNAILLPNRGEFSCFGVGDLEKIVGNGNVVVRKLPRALIYSEQGVFENHNGNAGLTRSGTGDVLAGLAAGFLAQSKSLLQSAINAVYCLGLLGDELFSRSGGPFYLASDLANEIVRLGILLKK